MKNATLIAILLLNFMLPAWALDVGEISSFIHSDNTTLSKEIKNPTTSGRLIHIRVERITNPLAQGQIIPMESKSELLLSPERLLLPANSQEIIRFYYQGPKDNHERYYRIIWFDQALSDPSDTPGARNAIATASARISTILVVAPRQVNYDYHYANGKMTNTGNATLRLIAYGPCLKVAEGGECKETYYLMPGRSRQFSHVNVSDNKARVAFWQAEHFIPVK